jgi:Escherichia/Staphylococcus phage prohead protease
MQRIDVKATTVATDLGQFTAIAAAYTVDRQNERIAPGAFTGTIRRSQASGKAIPVHWDHRGEASNVIGSVDPASMRETGEGLYVEGQLDIDDSETAREVWRSVKRGRASLSFGFLVKSAHKDGDVRVFDEIDLFEISIVAAPANEDSRILSTKTAVATEQSTAPTVEELRERERALGLEDPEITRVREHTRAHFYKLLTADTKATSGVPSADELRARAKELGIDPRPIQVVSFEVK